MKEIFPNVYREGDKFYTPNLDRGKKVYGEELINRGNEEYREWDPDRSKLAAALKKGLDKFPFGEGSKILYLGAGQGTTSSHLSDIVKEKGIIYLVEFSERAVRDLLEVCERRENMVPILADARKPEEYSWVEEVDTLYEDVAQPDQLKILKRNAERFLKRGGYAIIAVKSRAIDAAKDPEEIYEETKEEMERKFDEVKFLKLDPWEKDHCLLVGEKS